MVIVPSRQLLMQLSHRQLVVTSKSLWLRHHDELTHPV